MKATVKYVSVGQACRGIARAALKEAKVSIIGQGYTDGSTSWTYAVRTGKSPIELQDIVWASGLAWCNVKTSLPSDFEDQF